MPRESLADKRNRAASILALLRKHYPNARCSLDFSTVHQLMVATILSAQCTDDRVNRVTPGLFAKYRCVRDFAEADLTELGQDVYATGFHNNKAKAIKISAQQLIERHSGEIPRNLADLTALTGVGRKTGSVILGAGFGLAEGIVVDTHVARISRLLGFTTQTDPVKIERDLIKIILKDDWIALAHLLIDHGRAVCRARRPDCASCFLAELCPSASV